MNRVTLVGFDISALDPQFKAHAQRGIGRYVSRLRDYFDSHKEALEPQIGYFDHRSLLVNGSALVSAANRAINVLPAFRATARQQLLYQYLLSRARDPNGGQQFAAFHFPAHMDAPAWGMRKYALTVLDLIPLVCADLYRAHRSGLRFRFARWLELSAIRNAALLICISENTARDVNRLLGIPWERMAVTPLGVEEKFFSVTAFQEEIGVRQRYGIPLDCPVVMYVGGIDPRKNYPSLIKALAGLRERQRARSEMPAVLLMVGAIQEDREYPRLLRLSREHGVSDAIITPGYLPDGDLLKLYGLGSVFFFPSVYEGFGLPPLEAMAAGVPVVSSGTSALPEVLGDAAVVVDPYDIQAAVEALDGVIINRNFSQELSDRGRKRARLFNWDRTGQQTLEAYQRLFKIVER